MRPSGGRKVVRGIRLWREKVVRGMSHWGEEGCTGDEAVEGRRLYGG